uniref:Uncharacterized protein n=1 Tax=Rhizophora mucronata TaxID=61149 RepID=A0A2P2IY29_RHIMU
MSQTYSNCDEKLRHMRG